MQKVILRHNVKLQLKGCFLFIYLCWPLSGWSTVLWTSIDGDLEIGLKVAAAGFCCWSNPQFEAYTLHSLG